MASASCLGHNNIESRPPGKFWLPSPHAQNRICLPLPRWLGAWFDYRCAHTAQTLQVSVFNLPRTDSFLNIHCQPDAYKWKQLKTINYLPSAQNVKRCIWHRRDMILFLYVCRINWGGKSKRSFSATPCYCLITSTHISSSWDKITYWNVLAETFICKQYFSHSG